MDYGGGNITNGGDQKEVVLGAGKVEEGEN
jgi:hypothetical protein